MNMNKNRNRRTVEIYFVLYLAALVFLLPKETDKRNGIGEGGEGTNVFESPFSLVLEKTNLTCRLSLDSAGPVIISHDSLNTIYYTGDVEDVKYEFIVEDQSLKQTLPLSTETFSTSKYFHIEEHKDKQSATFYWTPPIQERTNKTYLVKVIATGKSRSTKDNPLGEQYFKAKTQFSLNMIFVNSGSNLFNPLPFDFSSLMQRDSLRFDMLNFPVTTNPISTGRFSLIPENDNVRGIAYQKWTNIVYANNINLIRDLLNKPNVSVRLEPSDNGGEASFDLQEDKIVVYGKTPSHGKMKVEVKIIRKYDEQEYRISFNVSPTPFQQPIYEKYMYPGISYLFEPRLPLVGKDVKAILRDGREVRVVSQGESFRFTPDISDTGKVLYFERYVDNNLLGEKYITNVLNYPNPEILDIQFIKKGEVKILTRCYGLFGKEKNYIEKFEVSGNAHYRELFGRTKEIPSNLSRLQEFVFTIKDPDAPFNFRFTAFDKRNKRSLSKAYNED